MENAMVDNEVVEVVVLDMMYTVMRGRESNEQAMAYE